MIVLSASYEILTSEADIQSAVERIAAAARTCYKSEKNANAEADARLVKSLIDRKHDAMLEFADLHVKFTISRGIANELVRHRMCSFAQESTRYCNYAADKFGKTIRVIKPSGMNAASEKMWTLHMRAAERTYFDLISLGCKPEIARSVLPTCLKTELHVKANIREWRHILKLRTSKAAHPAMREIMIPLLHELQEITPLFDDIIAE